jgi:hypothetical protein
MLRYHSAPSGHWLLAATGGRLLVVAAPDDRESVERTWAVVTESAGIQAVLDHLASNGLSATPPFALIEWSGELETSTATAQVIVRGGASVTAVASGDTIVIDGASATTWVERSLEGVASIGLSLGTDPGVDVAALADLPLSSGVAWVDAVAVTAGGATAPFVAAPAPAATAVPAAVTAPPVAPPAPQLVSPPSAPIIVPVSAESASEIEDATIAEFTITSVPEAEEHEAEEHAGLAHAAEEPAAAAELPEAPEEAPVDNSAFGYDSLFEETMVRSIEEAAVRQEEVVEEAAKSAPIASEASVGDHDGMTMMGADFAALREARKKAREAGGAKPAPSIHQGPSYHLEISTGSNEPLGQTVLVGRAPSVSKISGGQIPRLVTLTGNEDISRNHAQFTIEGDTVVVTDLHSRNGTIVTLPGRSPQQLRAGEPTSVLANTVVDLGGGVTLTIRES